MIITETILTIDYGLRFIAFGPPEYVGTTCASVYLIADCVTAIATMILFFRPICCRFTRSLVKKDADKSVVRRYGIISALQMIVAVTFQLSFVGGILLGNDRSVVVLRIYYSTCAVIQLIDCLLLMLCIHFGFARKRTVCTDCVYSFRIIRINVHVHRISHAVESVVYFLFGASAAAVIHKNIANIMRWTWLDQLQVDIQAENLMTAHRCQV